MSWDVTADPERFEEASRWFEERVPGIDTGVAKERAEGNAFRIAGMLELDAVQVVFDELARALDKGTPLEDFKDRVKEKLGTFSSSHLETVFRNWSQTAYNTGRYYQMSEPSVAQLRPYWLFDTILDDRTTSVCKVCSGTVKLRSDPWWDTHWPPQHHRCRSSVRSIRAREAVRRGITETNPAPETLETWGKSPRIRDDIANSTPKSTDYAADVWAVFQSRRFPEPSND